MPDTGFSEMAITDFQKSYSSSASKFHVSRTRQDLHVHMYLVCVLCLKCYFLVTVQLLYLTRNLSMWRIPKWENMSWSSACPMNGE